MEEYSSDDEVDMPKNCKTVTQIDTVIIYIYINFTLCKIDYNKNMKYDLYFL